mmetsp:Transcript_56738/g.93863  ORF Transcript_56738/g.93863 Transcript_56738/m.93863 type:complete len:261 (+) Transcript_56738:97-879(+)
METALASKACGLFDGTSGKAVVLVLTGGAFITYVGIYVVRSHFGTDRRACNIFWLDLLKMGFGQGFAYLVNVINAHRNSDETSFDAVSWYFPTFLNDELIAVPLGVCIWHLLIALVRKLGDCVPSCGDAPCFRALRHSGRYYDTQHSSKGLVASKATCFVDPDVRYSWWLVQLLFWVICVIASRLLGGLVVPLVARLFGDHSPYFVLARAIHNLKWSCAAKRWTFAGVFRIVIDLIQLAVVDFFNKFSSGRRKMTRTACV